MFDGIAGSYDLLNSLMTAGLHHRWRELGVLLAKVGPGDSALDVCCGTGDFAFALRRAVGREGRVVGVDFSEQMLTVAREKCGRNQLWVDFVHGDLLALPFADGEFDACTVGFGIRNVPDIVRAFGEMRRVCRPGGRVVCLEITRPEILGFKQFYNVWFDRAVPWLGRLTAGDAFAYSYLPASVRRFPDPDTLRDIMAEAGLVNARFEILAGRDHRPAPRLGLRYGMRVPGIGERVRQLMPEVARDLGHLVALPSIAFSGYRPEPVLAAAEATLLLLRRVGMADATLLDVGGRFPIVWGELPAPPGAPTVLLYAHYDVQPAPADQGWTTDPWTAVERDGRLYGRGAADNKSGVVLHAASLAAYGGRPPVGVKVLIEGEEEAGGRLDEYVAAHPDLFACDVFVIGDMGNVVAGEPALTISLRGTVGCVVDVRTLPHAVHSGVLGGPAPDALMVLIRLLATLHDDHGEVAVAGLSSYDWPGSDLPEDVYRAIAGLASEVPLLGSGSVASRLWSKPAVNVIGLDAPPVDKASTIVVPRARAMVSLRVVPGSDPTVELRALTDHLRAAAPWGVQLDLSPMPVAHAFAAGADGPAVAAARRALADAYGRPAVAVGSGGSIPLLSALQAAVPRAEFVLWGAEDTATSRIHGPDESVDLAELERCIHAQSLFFSYLVGTTG